MKGRIQTMNETPETEMTSQPVRSLQYMLNRIAIQYPQLPRLAVDGIFGERTLEAVMLFQRDFHPPVTGVVNNETWNAIRATYLDIELQFGAPPPLSVLPNGSFNAPQGEECSPILIVQAMFSSLSKVVTNFNPCEMNACNDGETHKNLRTIQSLAGLPITGTLDRVTWSYLVQLYQALVTRG